MRPERLDVDPHNPDAGKIFKFWLKSFELFLKTLQEERQAVTASSSSSGTTRLPKLRLLLTSPFPAIYEYVEDVQSYEGAVEILKKACKKHKNPVFARHLLATRGQRSDESLAEFVQALKVLEKDCEFKDVTAAKNQDLIRDAFINGITSSTIRQRLLEHSELDIRTAIDLADSLDMAQKQSASCSSCKVSATVSAIAACKDDISAKMGSPNVAVQKKRTVERQTILFLLWVSVESHPFQLPCSGQHLQGMRN